MLKQIERYCLEIISGKKRGMLPFFVRFFLHLFSWFYRFGVFCRNWAFDHHWLRRYHPPVPVVVSVGNIVAGGTGKTPVAMMLVKQFYQQFPIAILSRGYRSPAEHLTNPISLSRGEGPLYPASYCGDEPYLMAQNFPKAMIFVGRNRQKASTLAAKAGAKLLVLDDGLQYRYLARDFEIIIVDGSDPFGKGYFLPRGFLRESLKALSRADLIMINRIKDRAHYLTIKHKISRYSSAPVIAMQPMMAAIKNLEGKEISSLKGIKVGVFCGIANPERFVDLVKGQEAIVVEEFFAPDHILPDQEALLSFAYRCQSLGADYLVCTEKDRVKLSENVISPLPILWIKMQLSIVEGQVHWSAFLDKIKDKLEKDLSSYH